MNPYPRARLCLQLRVLTHEVITALWKRTNALPNTTQHLQGIATSGTSASEFHGSGVTDGQGTESLMGKTVECERRGPEKGNQKTKEKLRALKMGMKHRPFLLIWISILFCCHSKTSILPPRCLSLLHLRVNLQVLPGLQTACCYLAKWESSLKV